MVLSKMVWAAAQPLSDESSLPVSRGPTEGLGGTGRPAGARGKNKGAVTDPYPLPSFYFPPKPLLSMDIHGIYLLVYFLSPPAPTLEFKLQKGRNFGLYVHCHVPASARVGAHSLLWLQLVCGTHMQSPLQPSPVLSFLF